MPRGQTFPPRLTPTAVLEDHSKRKRRMRWKYTRFDERFRHLALEEQLRKLFLELLVHTGGDVEEALEALDDIAQRYGLWPEGMDIEQFRDEMIAQGYIQADRRPGKGSVGDKRPPRYTPTRKAEK